MSVPAEFSFFEATGFETVGRADGLARGAESADGARNGSAVGGRAAASRDRASIDRLLATGSVRRGSALPATKTAEPWSLAELAGRIVEVLGPPVRRMGRDSLRPAAGARATMLAALVAEAHRQREPVAWIGGLETVVYPPDLAAHGVDLAALAFVRVASDADRLRAADVLVRSGGFGLVIVEFDGGRLAADSRRSGVPVGSRSGAGPRFPAGTGREGVSGRSLRRADSSGVRRAGRQPVTGRQPGIAGGRPAASVLSGGSRSDGWRRSGDWVRLAGLAKHHDCVVCCISGRSGGGGDGHAGRSTLGSAVSLRVIASRQRCDGHERGRDRSEQGHDGRESGPRAGEGRFDACVRVIKDKRSGGGRWTTCERTFRGPLGVR